jgi:cellobiose phosphorylase
VIPASWPGFKATRKFRGVTYHIEVKRVGKGNRVSLEVDGTPIQGNTITPPSDERKEVVVKVTLA